MQMTMQKNSRKSWESATGSAENMVLRWTKRMPANVTQIDSFEMI